MTQLSDLYNTRIMELAAAIPRTTRLAKPDVTATAHVADFGQNVRACLLGQASASVVGREIVGATPAELAALAADMRAMLRDGSATPQGRWADLAVLEPVRAVKARHASTLLVFDAVEKALALVSAAAAPATLAAAAAR
jgi:NifU-like protein involved in Fe-S cluster formation